MLHISYQRRPSLWKVWLWLQMSFIPLLPKTHTPTCYKIFAAPEVLHCHSSALLYYPVINYGTSVSLEKETHPRRQCLIRASCIKQPNRPVLTNMVPPTSRRGSLTSLTVVQVSNGLLQGDRLWLFVLASFQPFPVSGAEFAHLGVLGWGVATFSLFHLQL